MRKLMLTLIAIFAMVTVMTHISCTTNNYYMGDDGNFYPYHQLPADVTESNVPKELK